MANPASKTNTTSRILGVLIFGSMVIYVGYLIRASYRNLADLISDSGYFRFDREHHLPHGYTRHEENSLKRLAGSVVVYAQHHKGNLPDLSNSSAMPGEVMQFGCRKRDFYNPATHHPFTPNIALSGRHLSEIANRNTTVIFYDNNPPATYTVRFGVTLTGRFLRSDSPADNALLTKRS